VAPLDGGAAAAAAGGGLAWHPTPLPAARPSFRAAAVAGRAPGSARATLAGGAPDARAERTVAGAPLMVFNEAAHTGTFDRVGRGANHQRMVMVMLPEPVP
ncbi:unnamed protein product, partial [Prorocentrum cordatum]